MEHMQHRDSALLTWVVIFLLLLIVSFKAGLAYFLIGDRGQPDWDFRPVKDVPGESPYAIYEVFPFPQHVQGDSSDYPQPGQDFNQSLFPPPKQNVTGE